ncbi:MAG: ShlB/FhaC/HecB family hemolysin secretion/activation protein [Alphaproteobacteria bacterium]
MNLPDRSAGAARAAAYAIGAALVFFAAPVLAAPPVPSSAEAGRLQQQQYQQPQAQSEPEAAGGGTETIAAPEGADKITFTLKEIIIEGSQRYSSEELLAPYRDLPGKTVSVQQIYDVASSILRRYHRDGFSFVSVYLPPQQIAGGVVRIRVVEGHVTRVDAPSLPHDRIFRQFVAEVEAMHPLDARVLEEDMLLLNDLPGLTVTSVIEPDKEDGGEGALVLHLDASRKRLTAGAALNNYGSRYTGPWQVLPSAAINGLTGNYDQTGISALSNFPYREGHFATLTHSEPIDLRTSVAVSVSTSASAPAFTLTPEDVRSDTREYSLLLRHQLLRSRAESWAVNGEFDVHDLRSDLLGGQLYDDRLRIARLGTTYDLADRWQGSDLLNLTLSEGISGLGSSKDDTSKLSRAQGKSNFTSAQFTASRLQRVTDTLGLYALASGQYAFSPLLASEEFGYGGPVIGRAYDAYEISGDDGLTGTAELRYYGLPAWGDVQTQPFLFYDLGKVWNLDSNGVDVSGSSAGFGARFHLPHDVEASLDVAWPLTLRPSAPQWKNSPMAPRIGFGISYQY